MQAGQQGEGRNCRALASGGSLGLGRREGSLSSRGQGHGRGRGTRCPVVMLAEGGYEALAAWWRGPDQLDNGHALQ